MGRKRGGVAFLQLGCIYSVKQELNTDMFLTGMTSALIEDGGCGEGEGALMPSVPTGDVCETL